MGGRSSSHGAHCPEITHLSGLPGARSCLTPHRTLVRALSGPSGHTPRSPDGHFSSRRGPPAARAGASAAGLRGPEARSPQGRRRPPPPPGRRPEARPLEAPTEEQAEATNAGPGLRGEAAARAAERSPAAPSADVPGARGQDSALPLPRACVQPPARTEENKACPPSSYWPRNPSAWSRLRVLSHPLRAPGPRPTPCTACGALRAPQPCPQALRVWLPDPTDLAFPAPPTCHPCPSPSCSLRRTCRYWLALLVGSLPLPPCPQRLHPVCPLEVRVRGASGALPDQRLPPTPPLAAQAHQAESPGQWPGPMAHMVPRSVGLAGMWPSPAIFRVCLRGNCSRIGCRESTAKLLITALVCFSLDQTKPGIRHDSVSKEGSGSVDLGPALP